MKHGLKFAILLLISISPIFGNPQEEMFRRIPKAELHLHLGGSYPLPYLLSIASSEQKKALEEDLKRIAKSLPYHECFHIFGLIAQIVNTEEKVEKGVEALCDFLAEDGVVYAEIRTGLKDFGKGYESYLTAVLRGADSAKLPIRFLLSLQRSSSVETAKKTVDLALKYSNQGVVGIDISGNSTVGNIEPIIPELLRAKKEGLFLTLHMGESPQEKGQLQLLERIQPHRIGHGVHLSPDALEWILNRQIPIEVCLTSSKLAQMVQKDTLHPGIGYYLEGHPITLCTDDPLIFQTSLSQELNFLAQTTALSWDEIEALAKKSLDYAFLRK